MATWRKSATLCVICGDRVSHAEGDVVGRKPNGVARLLCGKRACRKAWADPDKRAAVMSRWVENRDQ